MTAVVPPDFLVDSISHPLDATVARSSAVALVGSRIAVSSRSNSGFSLPSSIV